MRHAAAGAVAMALLHLVWMLAVGALAAAPFPPGALAMALAAAVLSSALGALVVLHLAPRAGEVSSPSTSLAVIHAALGAQLVATSPGSGIVQWWLLLSLAVVLMGLLLVVAARLGLMKLVEKLPAPLGAGFVTGIAVLVIVSQLPSLLGLDAASRSGRLLASWAEMRPGAIFVGAISAATFLLLQRRSRGAAFLAAVLAGTLVHHLVAWLHTAAALGGTLRPMTLVADAPWSLQAPLSFLSARWLLEGIWYVLPFSVILAAQAMLNAGVTAASLSASTGSKADIDKTLHAQGVANIVCGLLGGLPLGSHGPLSILAARQGATVRMMAASAMIVLVAACSLGGALQALPLAAFAGVLVASGFGMLDPRLRRNLVMLARGTLPRSEFVPVAVACMVALTFVVASVAWAVLLGLLACLLHFTHAIARSSGIMLLAPTHESAEGHASIAVLRVRGALFFANAGQLGDTLAQVPPLASATS